MNAIPLQPADEQIVKLLDSYPANFWASAERNPREDLHAYLQYPAMMVPEIQKNLLRAVCTSQSDVMNVLDPFVGAATTMTSCMSIGLNFTGQDINPLAVLVARAKAEVLNDCEISDSKRRVISFCTADSSTIVEANFMTIDKWFGASVQVALSRIRRAIRRENDLRVRRFFWVALAETVRLVSNSRTSTYKLHIRTASELEARNLSPIDVFERIVTQNLHDLAQFKPTILKHIRDDRYTGRIDIHLQDSSQKIIKPATANQYDLLVTSPPYGDNLSTVPYGQFSYLPLQWIDFADIDEGAANEDWLRTTQEIDRRSIGGKPSRSTDLDISSLKESSPTLRSTMCLLSESPIDRQQRVASFLRDLDKSLTPILSNLRPNAYLVWIIGNRHVGGQEIPTDKILEEFLLHRDTKLIKRLNRRILYRRLAARNQRANMMREEHILVFRKLVHNR